MRHFFLARPVFALARDISAKRVRFRVRSCHAFVSPCIFLVADAVDLDVFNSCTISFVVLVCLPCDREAWEHGRQGSVKQQQQRQQQQRQQQQHERRLREQYLRQQFARSFDEESIAETEEDDDQLWDRVQYWFQV